MEHQRIAPHESIEIHEILSFKSTCLTKSVTMLPLVSDAELKSILKLDVDKSKKHLIDLRELLQRTGIGAEGIH